MSKKIKNTIAIIISIIIIGALTFIALSEKESLKITLSPNPAKMTTGNEKTIEVIVQNTGHQFSEATVTLELDNSKIDIVSTSGELDKNKIKFTGNTDEINTNNEQKIGTITIKAKENGTSAIELTNSNFKDLDGNIITPDFEEGLLASSIIVAPRGQTNF